jgi:hypothetical protein
MSGMAASPHRLIPPPRPALEQQPSMPFELPWQSARIACRPVIGDALLLQYPEVAISRLSSGVRAFIDIDPECGCWVWRHTNCEGYGYAPAAIRQGNPEFKADRFIYSELVGPIPLGFTLDHLRARGCLFRACCWPAHLQPVTHGENSRRGAADRHSRRYEAALAAKVRPLMAAGLSREDIHRRTGIGWRIIAGVAAEGNAR